jgi:hypothetical protein
MPTQQLEGQLQKEHTVNTIITTLILIITLVPHRKKTTTTRSVSERVQRKATIYILKNKEMLKGNNSKKTIALRNKVITRKPIKMIILIIIISLPRERAYRTVV